MVNSTHVLRIEGMNFDTTVYNTNDLSTIRGSSLCLEAIGCQIDAFLEHQYSAGFARRVMIGAAQAAFLLADLDETGAEEVRSSVDTHLRNAYVQKVNDPPFLETDDLPSLPDLPAERRWVYLRTPAEHMTFSVDVETIIDGDVETALYIAAIRARRRQMRMPNLPRSPGVRLDSGPSAERARLICPIDPLRQVPDNDPTGDATVYVAKHQYPGALEFTEAESETIKKSGNKRIWTSKRSSDLRTYGRDARRTLYPFQLQREGFEDVLRLGLFETHDFAQSFEDINGNAPLGLPASVPGKLAYVYFDGNGFGQLFGQLRKKAGGSAEFSELVANTNALALKALLSRYLENSQDGAPTADVWTRSRTVVLPTKNGREALLRELLRLETLLFGGEDVLMVLPAWLAFELTDFLLREFERFGTAELQKTQATGKVTYRAGLLICDAKTPARRAREIAHDLCEDAKAPYKGKIAPSCLSFHIAESHDLPELSGNTAQKMERLRRLYQVDGVPPDETSAAFRAASGRIAGTFEGVRRLKQEVPKSRIYDLLGALDSVGSEQEREFRLTSRLQSLRGRGGKSLYDLRNLLPAADSATYLRLRVLADLWDYVDPLGADQEVSG